MNRAALNVFLKYCALHRKSIAGLREYRNALGGSRVYVIGTGPSIAQTDLGKITGRNVLYLNNAYELRDRISPAFEVAIVSDFLRYREIQGRLQAMRIPLVWTTDRIVDPKCMPGYVCDGSLFVCPKVEMGGGGVVPSTKQGISLDIADGIYLGKSVVFPAIQFAAYMGAREIVLLGVDMTMNHAEYYSPAIKSNYTEFDYAKDAKGHFSTMYATLLMEGVALMNGAPGGVVNVLPRIEI